MKETWDQRFSSEEYIYGTFPNQFFREKIAGLAPGTLLLPAEGEGRNATYAALQGWKVTAMDFSEQAKAKALKLAEINHVRFEYLVDDLRTIDFGAEKYDAAALIYAHMFPDYRREVHERIVRSLKPGGYIILEGFNKKQVRNVSGGPKTEDLLYSIPELAGDFKGLEIILLEELTGDLSQGTYHQGKADMIRLFGKKPGG
jgi:SAM-dependent methyltransferase